MATLMVTYSRGAKARGREAILDLVPWRGDEAVLDVGCGRGLLLVGAARRLTRGHAVGVDVWQGRDQPGSGPAGALENARAESVEDRVRIETADMRSLPFADAAFDVVVSSWAAHNLDARADRALALAEMARVLRPGGSLVIADIANRDEHLAELARLGLGPARLVASRLRDALFGAVSFGSFRPATVVARGA